MQQKTLQLKSINYAGELSLKNFSILWLISVEAFIFRVPCMEKVAKVFGLSALTLLLCVLMGDF